MILYKSTGDGWNSKHPSMQCVCEQIQSYWLYSHGLACLPSHLLPSVSGENTQHLPSPQMSKLQDLTHERLPANNVLLTLHVLDKHVLEARQGQLLFSNWSVCAAYTTRPQLRVLLWSGRGVRPPYPAPPHPISRGRVVAGSERQPGSPS
ncbi:hypothetical protein Pmani_002960 [Petrolisthes manimaculis]|uniref:Uncharacterized protein n=1 Tax=Petrolisthes manimaculis TaxID=1843537 RepID=A0AAE1QHN8_9EUCA|nr:hypothetical protein Pmani_002960 [Petrolisthes manimaculis]